MNYIQNQRNRGRLRSGLLATAAALSLLTGVARAQESEAAEEETVEVVIRGFQNSLINRLPTPPQELPFALDIVSEAKLHERGYFNPLDVLETLPNVTRRNTQYLPTGGSYTIRGLYATVLTNNRPENDSRGAGRRDSSQIESFEVLKGPSSIMLGPIIPGGVINQVTKSPKPTDFVELIGRFGSYGTYRAEADFNEGALFGSEIVSARLTAAYEDQQSPQDPAFVKTFSVRPVVEANFTDHTRAQAAVAYTKRDSTPFSSTAVNSDGSVPSTIDAETYFGIPSDQTGEDLYIDGEFQHEFLNDLKLVVRGSVQDTDFDYQIAQSGYNYAAGRGFKPGDTETYVYYSHGYRNSDVAYADVQLTGRFDAFGQRNDWVVGASRQDTKFESYWAHGGVLGVVDITDIENVSYGTPDYSATLAPYRDSEDTLSSIYAETSLRPTERLTVVAGIRHDSYEFTNLTSGTTQPDEHVSTRIGATYKLTPAFNAYISYADSFVPQSGTVRGGGTIEPETAVNYEAGVKGRLWDGRVNLTASVFDLTRQNVATTDPANVPGGPAYVIATGEQKHKGFEVSVAVAVTQAFNIEFAYGALDAKITKVITPGPEDVGDPVAMAPDHTFSVFGTYNVQDGPLANLRLGIGARGISERPAPRFNLVYDGYTIVDGLIAYPLTEKVDIQLNVHNLFDEVYRETVGFSTGTTGGGHRFGNPRSAYVTVRARF